MIGPIITAIMGFIGVLVGQQIIQARERRRVFMEAVARLIKGSHDYADVFMFHHYLRLGHGTHEDNSERMLEAERERRQLKSQLKADVAIVGMLCRKSSTPVIKSVLSLSSEQYPDRPLPTYEELDDRIDKLVAAVIDHALGLYKRSEPIAMHDDCNDGSCAC